MTIKEKNNSVNLPRDPIDAFLEPFQRFLHIEAASGVVLLLSTITALVIANSSLAEGFSSFWKISIGFRIGSFEMFHSLQHWINDLLMAIFFFVIGLEVKRELVLGELRDMKRASLPLFAAIGGMVVPAAIYLILQIGTPGERGWGIVMATDIAFVVGSLAILGSRIPGSLRVLLLSLAIVDDIGAILVIAIGYTASIDFAALFFGVFCIAVFIILLKIGVRNAAIYTVVALLIWFGFHESGIHATIAGVIVGMLVPVRSWVSENRLSGIVQNTLQFLKGDGWTSEKERYKILRQTERAIRKTVSPLERFETDLHPWVGFLIMPIFALANAGVSINTSALTSSVAVAVILGLFIGKPAGIILFSWLGVKLKLAQLPDDINWTTLLGGGFLAGIGFTMAIFIGNLALSGTLLDAAKVGIIIGSVGSAVVGILILLRKTRGGS